MPQNEQTSNHLWRLIVDKTLLQNDLVVLNDEEHHYVFHVLRLTEGNKVELCDGKGTLALAEITTSNKKKIELNILSSIKAEDQKNKLTLFIGQPRPPALEESVHAAAELGATRFVICRTEKSAIKYEPKLDKLRRIAHESMRISKSVWAMEIVCYSKIAELIQHENLTNSIFLCDESPVHNADCPSHPSLLKACLDLKFNVNDVGVFVGPESSFSENEKDLLVQTNFKLVGLGAQILRVPAAVSNAISVVRAVQEST